MRLIGLFAAVALAACVSATQAAEHPEDPIYQRSVMADQAAAYDAVYHSLEESRFWVIAEPNIGKSLAKNEERWGENYNRNGYEAIRSLVFCSPWYANELSNLDPRALAMCPFSATMLYREGQATVLFERPTTVVTEGPAKELVARLEAAVVEALDRAIAELSAGEGHADSEPAAD
ncbi:MAG: hypothetical protein AAGA68_25000 [Pseudomonadota bacterium]